MASETPVPVYIHVSALTVGDEHIHIAGATLRVQQRLQWLHTTGRTSWQVNLKKSK